MTSASRLVGLRDAGEHVAGALHRQARKVGDVHVRRAGALGHEGPDVALLVHDHEGLGPARARIPSIGSALLSMETLNSALPVEQETAHARCADFPTSNPTQISLAAAMMVSSSRWLTAQAAPRAPTLPSRIRIGPAGFYRLPLRPPRPGGNPPRGGASPEAGTKGHPGRVGQQPLRIPLIVVSLRQDQKEKTQQRLGLTVMGATKPYLSDFFKLSRALACLDQATLFSRITCRSFIFLRKSRPTRQHFWWFATRSAEKEPS